MTPLIHSLNKSHKVLFFHYCQEMNPSLNFLLFILLFNSAFADPPYEICSNTSFYKENSLFRNNLENLLIYLPSNASVSNFHNTSMGNGKNTAYALYMCYNYVTAEGCSNCITTASQDILKLCLNNSEAVVWEEACQLRRYANWDFFSQLDVRGNINKDNVQNIFQPEEFKAAVKSTLSDLTEKAAFNVPANMYATGEVPFLDKTIYALVQCTNDLSAESCNKCLQVAITDILDCCYFSIGARLLSRSCYLRYELYNFYGNASELPSPGDALTGRTRKKWIMVVIVSVCLAITLLGSAYCLAIRKKKGEGKEEISSSISDPNTTALRIQNLQERYEQFPYIDLAAIHAATNNFSESNRLGQGGFGPVYKGVLRDGQEVAIKRLSSCSEQGAEEFINEVLLIMKLQHKNLVRLLGFCVDREEKLLVYEFMPNCSLDVFLFGNFYSLLILCFGASVVSFMLFSQPGKPIQISVLDPKRRAQLSWSKRLNIIHGIARGILYLHEDSRLRIIHRDLKASNVLLDHDMNPKISDFGMARIFAGTEGEANTATIVGTYGYMSPEYAMEGLYSTKSDVFSFGVLLLEILTGKKNTGFHLTKLAPSLQAYVRTLWNMGRGSDLIDSAFNLSCSDEFLRYIHIGLLCVQEDANERPTMSDVVVMLRSESMALAEPGRPAMLVGRYTTDNYEIDSLNCSVNGLTISNLVPR